MNSPRSYLFVPANRPDRFSKAAASGADQIILDLEDAVGPEEKDTARQNVVNWFAQGGSGLVRINAADTPWFEADAEAVVACHPSDVMVPKADARTITLAEQVLKGSSLVALIESVNGYMTMKHVAEASNVTRMAFGNLDFGLDARIPGIEDELNPVRFQLAIWSRCMNLLPPIDGVTVDLSDESVLSADIRRARNLGFTAKLCIHPRQVLHVNEAFAPSVEEIEWAHRVMQALEESEGAAVQVDGKMVDRPVQERARELLAGAETGTSQERKNTRAEHEEAR